MKTNKKVEKTIKANLMVFTIFDKLAGQYSLPIVQQNKDIAKQYFLTIVNKKIVENVMSEPTEYSLYFNGYYDETQGIIHSLEKPEFIMHGELVDKIVINRKYILDLNERLEKVEKEKYGKK